MRLSYLNLLTAAAAFAGSFVWFATGQIPTGVVWLAGSLIWLIVAVYRLRASTDEPRPGLRFTRRLSRLLLWS